MTLRKLETGRVLVTGRPGRRRFRLLGDLKETRDYLKDRNDGKTKKKTQPATG